MVRRPLPVRRLAAIALLAAPRLAGADEPAWIAEALAAANARRRALGREPLVLSLPLGRAAEAEARELAQEAELFPSSRPEQIAALVCLEDLPGRLRAAGYRAHRAKAHVIVSEALLATTDLPGSNPALAADLLDGDFHELGLAVARGARMEIGVAILGLSVAEDFARRTRGLGDPAAVRSELLELSNRERSRHQRRPLRADRCLDQLAERYAERMLAEGFYGHTSPEGRDVLARARAAGCRGRRFAENLARGQTTGEQVIGGWTESPAHRDNLLGRRYRRVGHGLALGLRDGEGWIVWVQVLGGD